jgi:hypothetical protein
LEPGFVECMFGIGDKQPILHDPHCTINRWNHFDSTASSKKTQELSFSCITHHNLTTCNLTSRDRERITIYYCIRGRTGRCWGIFVTTMPGRKSSAAFKRRAVWLCNRCSHQWVTTNSGKITVTVSSGKSSWTVSI